MAEDYKVIVLFDGYSKETEQGTLANCTCTLILGPKKIIVDTMTAWDGKKISNALKQHNITCDEIDFVVCTHGHSDHVGCNYLFQKAVHVMGYCISHEDAYFEHSFNSDGEYVIDERVKVIATPGHTAEDVSVIVTTDHMGVVAVTGDLFENENDLKDDRIWRNSTSGSAELQLKNRNKILEIASYIIPGHGPIFKCTPLLKADKSDSIK